MEEQKFYRYKWIGVLCTILFPGSAHFFAGQRMVGIFLLFGYVSLFYCGRFIASIPGKPFGVLSLFLFFMFSMYLILLLVLSWLPIRRLGTRGWVLFILFALIFNNCIYVPAILLFSQHVSRLNYGSDSSMKPTLCSLTTSPSRLADVYVDNTWIYHWNNPKRGDIVIFCDKFESNLWTKRVVGLPGETVDIDPPYILINGKQLTEPDIFRKISECQEGFNGYCFVNSNNRIALPVTLGNDEYFLLGDNSEVSVDSRVFGPVKRSDIKSKVIRIILPFSRIKEF